MGIRQPSFFGGTGVLAGHYSMNTISHEAVAHCAHKLWQDSGCVEGRDLENWNEAERILATEDSPAPLEAALHQGASRAPDDSPADYPRDEFTEGQKHEARAAKVPSKSAPHAKPPESGKPLWNQPHSR